MLQDTGERIIPDEMKATNGMLLEHIARYHFALPYAGGRVLDIACGSGYGAQLTAKSRKNEVSEVTAVDVDEETIHYARGRYYHPSLTYTAGDLLDPELPEKIGTFDTILSFETLEHLPDDKECLQRLAALLKPGGTLVLSTPFGAGRHEPCRSPFHYFQLTEQEFTSLLHDSYFSFASVQQYYQLGVSFDQQKRPGVHYPIGIAVVTAPESTV
ncbi:SAM-dependent methyltransferase [Alkalicoccus urumqiensis]|uniref:SAM-dependent methyltransferase n=2 Tax=Alkalicoccus urumqiensis TaxID=1548213 RepID=A0A2P6MIH9_ALKUR|nr:SAM-dependent methyltransferase [Alkalicoccus urumqiensis]